MSLLDWGAALFSYGKQIIGAVAQGAWQGVGDLVHDPIQLGLTIVAPEYMAVYQLARVLTAVAGISLRALTDWEQTKKEVNDWIDPLIDALDRFANGDIPITDVARIGTRLTVGMQAQKLFCSGIKGFCSQLTNNISDQHRTQMQKFVDTINRRCSYLKNQGCVVFSPEAIEKEVRYVMRSKNNFDHIFANKEHYLERIVEKLGNEQKALEKALELLNNQLYAEEVFNRIININNYQVCVRGRVINQIPFISTMFIPKDTI